jgi:outer membrane protein assembly factor BamE (lipoprotein component of BamABCDE complex)
MKTRLFSIPFIACIILLFAGCESTKPNSIPPTTSNPLTHGNVQLTLKKGITTQTEVLEKFGAPNITTLDASGKEVWTYQKQATVANAAANDAGIWLIFVGSSKSESGFEQSSRTMTLIIKFDENKIVYDFNSFSSSF